MMKKCAIISVLMCAALFGTGQPIIHIGTGGSITISAGERVSLNGLVLAPSTVFALTPTTIEKKTSVTQPAVNPEVAIQRVYSFSNALPAFDGSLRIYYDDPELGGTDELSLALNVYNDGHWTYPSIMSADQAANYIETHPQTFNSIAEVTITPMNAVLPLRWGGIKASREGEHVEIRFECYEPEVTGQFSLEKLTGNSWKAVAYLSITDPAQTNYFFKDEKADKGELQYRICAISKNEQKAYSKIITVAASVSRKNIIVYPNPARTEFQVRGAPSAATISLFNSAGITIRQWKTMQPYYSIQDLPSGTYWVVMTLADGSKHITTLAH